MPEAGRPRAFLSHAGDDRATAERLRRDLRECGIEVFVFPPGVNLVQDINCALTQSDYFILLWSQACVDRPWVNAEWSAAFVRELQERRSFLFIVRLDTTPLPALLAPRHYLDAFGNWDEMVGELTIAWCRDRAVGEPVLPAPYSAVPHNDAARTPTIVLYVRNRALSVAHVITVPENVTGQELENVVRHALALPDIETKFNGAVGIRFYYQLKNGDKPIPADRTPMSELCITDGATIDLEVQVGSFGPEGSSPTITYRQGESAGLSPVVTRSLIKSAFAHLIPW
jgi:hypothetical protein